MKIAGPTVPGSGAQAAPKPVQTKIAPSRPQRGAAGVSMPTIRVKAQVKPPSTGKDIFQSLAGLAAPVEREANRAATAVAHNPKLITPQINIASAPALHQVAPKYLAIPSPDGILKPGNIDLNARPVVHNPDGSISTVRSISITVDGKGVLIPTVIPVNGVYRVVSDKQAIDYYDKTGENLGVFTDWKKADAYAQKLHESQAKEYLPSPGHEGPAGPILPTAPSTPANDGLIGSRSGGHGLLPGDRIAIRASAENQGPGFGELTKSLGNNLYNAFGVHDFVDELQHPADLWQNNPRISGLEHRQNQAADSFTEAVTGYKQIENIRHDPLGGGLALAALFPPIRGLRAVGEGLRAAHVAEDGARISAGANAAKDSFEAGKGLVAPLTKAGARKAARLARKAAVRGAPRSEEESVQHVLETASKAKQQGFGRVLPKVPEIKPGEVTAETGGEAGKIVRAGLGGEDLGPLRNEQEAARSIERGKRATQAMSAASEKSGLDRLITAKSALEGKLPAGEFKGFSELDPALRDEAINHIFDHPHLQDYERIRTAEALDEAIQGKVPTKGDQALLERAFGKEQAVGLIASIQNGSRTVSQTLLDVMAIPKSLRSSFDLSAPGRQALVMLAHNPKLWFSELKPMAESVRSEGDFQGLMDGIHAMPEYPLMEKSGLALTDIGESAKAGGKMAGREEAMPSNIAERLPVIGRGVRMSDRAYTGYLNLVRAKSFASLTHLASAQGYHLTDEALKGIADFVNVITGRGDIKNLAHHLAWMNSLLFSPRLWMSRVQFLNPVWFARLPAFARRQAIETAVKFYGGLSLVLYLAHLAGAQVGIDPRNADFAKVRIGNTRLDFAGGFQQNVRLIGQIASGEIVSSTTGKLEPLAGGFAGRSRLDVLQQFFEGKLAPTPAFLKDLLTNKQFSGQPLDFSLNPLDTNSELSNLYEPLSWQDAYSTGQQTHSVAAGIGGGLLSGIGVGVQSYTGSVANSPDKIAAADAKALATLRDEEAKVPLIPDAARAELERGVKLQVELELAKQQAANSSQSGKLSARQSYKITLLTLKKAGMMSASQYRSGVAAMPRMTDHDLAHWEYEAWTNLGPGKLLTEFHHAYNTATGN